MNLKRTLEAFILIFVFSSIVNLVPVVVKDSYAQGKKPKQTVTAVFPVTVDAFVKFQEEAESVFKKNGVEFLHFSAEGDKSRFQTIINAAILKKPDVIIFVGTQLTNTGLAPKYEQILPKVVSSCISDPSKVEQLVSIGLSPTRKKTVAILSDMPKQDLYSFGADLIRSVLPNLKKAGILYNEAEINSKNTATKMSEALKECGIDVANGIVTGEADVDKIARNLILQGAELLIIPHDKYVIKKAATLVKIGNEVPDNPVPVFSLDDGTVRKDGAAFGVSIEYGKLGKLTAEVTMEILNGAAPEKMPIIMQETANAYFNMNSWKRLGLPQIPDRIKDSAILY